MGLKCTKFNFGWGPAPDAGGGACSAPQDFLVEFKGPISKGRGLKGRGEEKEKGMQIRKEGEGKEGRERNGNKREGKARRGRREGEGESFGPQLLLCGCAPDLQS